MARRPGLSITALQEQVFAREGDVTVYRGDDKPIARDMKLGHLRDTYYEAEYGTLAPDAPV